MITILVVEDNLHMRMLMEAKLRPHYQILTAGNGHEALEKFYENSVDLIVADIMMPGMDGYEMVRRLREDGQEVPVLFLSALGEFKDKRKGFELGIDDYVTKPVDFEELILRIKALLRRAKIADSREIRVGDFAMDEKEYTVKYRGELIEMTRKEFELLFRLLSYPNTVMTKAQLLESVWGYASNSGEETIKTHINKIRRKLVGVKEFEIVAVKGLGYKAVVYEN